MADDLTVSHWISPPALDRGNLDNLGWLNPYVIVDPARS
jgi:hypothetical protein